MASEHFAPQFAWASAEGACPVIQSTVYTLPCKRIHVHVGKYTEGSIIHIKGRRGINPNYNLFQQAATSKLQAFWGPRNHQKQPQIAQSKNIS